jgi:hypothetical protein
MPILEIQSRMYERGRIRIGQKGAKGNPVKLDRFRFTSAARENLLPIAAAYGGEVVEWLPADGRQQYEVITDATRVPILLPPNPVSQWLELWSGGGCQRRCDGIRDVITDSPCICGPDPESRACKPTTRLNVVLRDMPGIGVWRLESHGWNAAVELPGLASFVAAADGMVPAFLTLEERVSKQDGQTRRFMVPGIDVDVTPSQLLANGSNGATAPAQVGGAGRKELEGPRPDYLELARAVSDVEQVRAIWKQAADAGHLTDELAAELMKIAQAKGTPASDGTADGGDGGDVDALWMQIVAAAPEGWTTPELASDFEQQVGCIPEKASAEQMSGYLDLLRTLATQAAQP